MGCPRSESHLDQCLQSLPRTLDETYERILCSIGKDWIEEARRILTLLYFSPRPLTVQELIDAVAVDLHEPACLNLRRRLHDADDFRQLCPGLIDVGVEVDDETQVDSDDTTSRWDPNEVEHATVRLSTPTLRAANSWYTLHWRPGGGSVIPQQLDNEDSNTIRRERAKAKKQRKVIAKKEQEKKDKDKKDKDGNAGGTRLYTNSRRVK
jgi:hypothetical protein